jgi:hypothetical protein
VSRSRAAPLSPDQARVRLAVYEHFAETGMAPDVAALAAACDLAPADVARTLSELAGLRALVLDPADGAIAMAHPFAARPTPFAVETARGRYYANCAWDALGMPGLLGSDGRIDATCARTGEPMPMAVDLRGGPPRGPGADGVVHIAVPFRRFWDDVFFT